jgi:hypothetical protein
LVRLFLKEEKDLKTKERQQPLPSLPEIEAIRNHTDFNYIPQRGWASIEEHTRLLDLIEQHAPASEIEQVVREHKLHTLEAYRNSSRYQTRLAPPGASSTT